MTTQYYRYFLEAQGLISSTLCVSIITVDIPRLTWDLWMLEFMFVSLLVLIWVVSDRFKSNLSSI
jgi:hypothetical protein